MSRFKFRLQRVLDHREIIQEKVKNEYLEALKKVNEKEAHLESMTQAILTSRENVFRSSSPDSHVQTHEFIQGQQIKIQREKLELRTLRMDLEEKHERYIQAFRDVKILDSLKERKKGEHKREALKDEQKVYDDNTLMRFKRK